MQVGLSAKRLGRSRRRGVSCFGRQRSRDRRANPGVADPLPSLIEGFVEAGGSTEEHRPAPRDYAQRLAPQIDTMLSILNVRRPAVRQVRMTRWRHALPVAFPGFIERGLAQHVRRPFQDHIYFVNQDNWSLPVFETCLLEAQTWSAEIDASL